MAWLSLIAAGLLEIVWATALKYADGLTHANAWIVAGIAMILSVALLTFAMRELPLGTAYMVWTGIGALGSFLAGIIFFSEPISLLRLVAALLILGGLLLMRIAS